MHAQPLPNPTQPEPALPGPTRPYSALLGPTRPHSARTPQAVPFGFGVGGIGGSH